jgi:hypothetical protein
VFSRGRLNIVTAYLDLLTAQSRGRRFDPGQLHDLFSPYFFLYQ